MLHKNAVISDIHMAHNWEYANAAARTGAVGFVAGDVGKLALQIDTQALYILSATTPTWTAVAGTAAGVAADTIWDAAGDLAVGSGANTAAKLSIGTALQVLRVNAGATGLEYAAPASGGIANHAAAADLATSGHPASIISIVSDTAMTVQDMHNTYNSAGVISTADFDNILTISGTAGKVDSAAFTVGFRTGTGSTDSLKKYSVAATTATISPLDNTEQYILCRYNAGTPDITTSTTDISDGRTIIKLGAALVVSGVVHMVLNLPHISGDIDNLEQRRNWTIEGVRYGGTGAIVSEGTGGKTLAVTASSWWAKLRKYNVADFNSGVAGTFWSYYYNGAAWVETASLTTIDATNYNNIASGLVALTNNRWSYYDVYLGVTDGDVRVIYGQSDAYTTQALAAAAVRSATLPIQVSSNSYKYVGRVIFQKSAASIAQSLSAFTTSLTTAAPTQHNGLGGLNTGDFVHLTAAEYAARASLGAVETFTASQRGTITTDNDLNFDLNVTNFFLCTPSAGGALTFTNIPSGQGGTIKLVNGAAYAITAAANTKVTSTLLATISATGTYIISYFSDGTNVYCSTSGAMA